MRYFILIYLYITFTSYALADDCSIPVTAKYQDGSTDTFSFVQDAIDTDGVTEVHLGSDRTNEDVIIKRKSNLRIYSTCDGGLDSITIGKSSDIVISGLTISSKRPFQPSVWLKGLFYKSDSITIIDNKINGSFRKSTGIKVGTHNTNVLILANEIYENHKDGIHVGYKSTVSIGNNHIHNNGHNGIFLSHRSDANVTSNKIELNGANGIKISKSGVYNISTNRIQENGTGKYPFHGRYGLFIGKYQRSNELSLSQNTIIHNNGYEKKKRRFHASRDIYNYSKITGNHNTVTSDGNEGEDSFLSYEDSGTSLHLEEKLSISINKDSLPSGMSLTDIKVVEVDRDEITPNDLSGKEIIGNPLDFSPDGLDLNGYLVVRIKIPENSYDPSEKKLKLSYYNESDHSLKPVVSFYDETSGELVAMLEHFSIYVAVAYDFVPTPTWDSVPNNIPSGYPYSLAHHPWSRDIDMTCESDMGIPSFVLPLSPSLAESIVNVLQGKTVGIFGSGFLRLFEDYYAFWIDGVSNLFGTINLQSSCLDFKQCVLRDPYRSPSVCRSTFFTDYRETCFINAYATAPFQTILESARDRMPSSTHGIINSALKLLGLLFTAVTFQNPIAHETFGSCLAQSAIDEGIVSSLSNKWESWRQTQVAYDSEFAKLISPPTCKLESAPNPEVYFDETARVQIGVNPETSYNLFSVVAASHGQSWSRVDNNSYAANLGPRNDLYSVTMRNNANGLQANCYASVTEKPILQREGIVGLYATTGSCGAGEIDHGVNLNGDTDGDYVHFCYKKDTTYIHVTDIAFIFGPNCPQGYQSNGQDLNAGNTRGGSYVQLCTKSEDTRVEAVKPVTDFLVYEDDNVVNNCPSGYHWHPEDLNQGARKETCSWRGCGELDSRNIYFCSKK